MKHKEQISKVFTYENLPAILEVFNSFSPTGNIVEQDQFVTLVNATRSDYHKEMIGKVIEYVTSHASLPTNITE